jgi:type IV pilus assembly protein PilB
MSRPLFGQYLGQVVEISDHDVAEILEDQAASRRRFGEIALAWGLCQPEHVWLAWCHQLARLTPEVDLKTLGIDAQSMAHLPRALAEEFHVVPVRSFRDQLVVAADQAGLARASNELPKLLSKSIKLVVASRASIDAAIREYYAPHTAPNHAVAV